MKIALISPREAYKPRVFKERDFNFIVPCLGMMQLAALTPQDIDVVIIEETYQEISYDIQVDLVGVSIHAIPVYRQAFHIADKFKERHVPTILGGKWIEPILKESLDHFDSVVIGDAEDVWPDIVDNFKNNSLKRIYYGKKSPSFPENSPLPRRDLHRFDPHNILIVQPVVASKGCIHQCNFCSVAAIYGNNFKMRPIKEVIREIEEIENEYILIVDDNFYANPEYTLNLLNNIAGFKKRINCQITIESARDKKFLKAAEKAGMETAFIGYETLSQKNLESIHKHHNRVKEFEELTHRFCDHGIGITASFVSGFDDDDPDVFNRILDFTDKNPITYLLHSILTPYPNTPIFKRLKDEGRIITEEWELYDREHVVFIPKNMTVEQLQEGYLMIKNMKYEWRMDYTKP